MTKAYPNIWWERYADDGVLHCQSYKQAAFIKQKLEERFQQFGLELNKEKTRIVYCKITEGHKTIVVPNSLFWDIRSDQGNKNKEGKFFVGFNCLRSVKSQNCYEQKNSEMEDTVKAGSLIKMILGT